MHYQALAQEGYANPYLTAFFPAYPMLARALAGLTGISHLLALVLLYRVTRRYFPEGTAGQTVVCALIFPSAIFLFELYPLSLMLLFTLLAYDQAVRGAWLAAGLAGLLAGLTHGTVVPLVMMLGVVAAQELRVIGVKWPYISSEASKKLAGTENERKALPVLRWLALPAAVILPGLGTLLFLAWREGMRFPPISEILLLNWSRVISPPWEMFVLLLRQLPNQATIGWTYWYNLGLLGIAIWSLVWGLRRLPLALSVYNLGMLLFLLSNQVAVDPLMSFNRYVMGMFPMYMALAGVIQGRTARLAYLGVTLLASLMVSVLFFMWKWVG